MEQLKPCPFCGKNPKIYRDISSDWSDWFDGYDILVKMIEFEENKNEDI